MSPLHKRFAGLPVLLPAPLVLFSALLVLLPALLFPAPAAAAVIHVPADQPTIQAGIDAALEGDTVLVADGTYTGEGNRDILTGGKAITICSENGPALCIIDCQGSIAEEHRGFRFDMGELRTTVVEGFTIRNGYAGTYGGAIYCSANPTIRGNVIENNVAEVHGGGIACLSGGALIENNEIRDNRCEVLSGGGIHVWHSAHPTITGNTITDNVAAYYGAGINLDTSAELTLSANVVANNQGSGIYATGSPVRLRDCVISGNTGIYGGIHAYAHCELEMDNCVVSGNTATGSYGGGISVGNNSSLSLTNCLISGNHSAGQGGGLESNDCPVVLESCTIAGNSAEDLGGGIYIVSDTLTVYNSILWGNTADTGQQVFLDYWYGGGVLVISYSDVEGGEDGVEMENDCTVIWGLGMLEADPLFVAGPNGEHYLSQRAAGQPADSPAVDAGDPGSGLIDGTTRTDRVDDAGVLDQGYHYQGGIPAPLLVSGPGPGPANAPLVRVFPPVEDAEPLFEFPAYAATGYGSNVNSGDLDGDGHDEIITGAGPGPIYGPHVRAFSLDASGSGASPLPGAGFLAYGTNRFGVNVCAGDLDGDGRDEIVTGAGPGAVFGPHVRAFAYQGGAIHPLPGVSYLAYGTPRWGVNVSTGDIDGDGRDEIVTGAGPGPVFGPHVRGWNVDNGTAAAISAVSYFAYATLRFGVNVACGDLDGDGMDEMITAPGPSLSFPSHVRGWNYDGAAVSPLAGCSFFAWTPVLPRYGARIGSGADLDGDGFDELVVGAGPDPSTGTPVRVYRYHDGTVSLGFSLNAFPSGFTHGATVAAGRF